MPATVLFPLDVWTSQITQASIPANENSLRVEVLEVPALGIANAPVGGEVEGNLYIVGATPNGAFSTFTANNVAILKGGTWLEFEAFNGWVKVVAGTIYSYNGTAWSELTVSATAEPSAVVSITASQDLDLSHAGKFINAAHATVAIAITVPPQSSVAWEDYTQIEIRQGDNAAVSFVAGSGVTIQKPASQTLAVKEKYGAVALKRIASDTWALVGMLGEV